MALRGASGAGVVLSEVPSTRLGVTSPWQAPLAIKALAPAARDVLVDQTHRLGGLVAGGISPAVRSSRDRDQTRNATKLRAVSLSSQIDGADNRGPRRRHCDSDTPAPAKLRRDRAPSVILRRCNGEGGIRTLVRREPRNRLSRPSQAGAPPRWFAGILRLRRRLWGSQWGSRARWELSRGARRAWGAVRACGLT